MGATRHAVRCKTSRRKHASGWRRRLACPIRRPAEWMGQARRFADCPPDHACDTARCSHLGVERNRAASSSGVCGGPPQTACGPHALPGSIRPALHFAFTLSLMSNSSVSALERASIDFRFLDLIGGLSDPRVASGRQILGGLHIRIFQYPHIPVKLGRLHLTASKLSDNSPSAHYSPTASALHPASSIKHPASSIQYPASSIQYPASPRHNRAPPPSNLKFKILNLKFSHHSSTSMFLMSPKSSTPTTVVTEGAGDFSARISPTASSPRATASSASTTSSPAAPPTSSISPGTTATNSSSTMFHHIYLPTLRLHFPFRIARCTPHRLPRASHPHAESRLARHPQRPRPRQGERRHIPPRLHQRMLRRPAHPPAEGGLLGQRESHRPPRRLRRGKALRRGDDDGVPSVSQS